MSLSPVGLPWVLKGSPLISEGRATFDFTADLDLDLDFDSDTGSNDDLEPLLLQQVP